MRPLLEIRNLSKQYRGRKVLADLSLALEPGQIVGLLGPNGSGKTTTFECIMGLVQPDRGSILLRGQAISHLPPHKRARQGIGYLAQETTLFRLLTVRDNLRAVLEIVTDSRDGLGKRIEEISKEVGISHLLSQKAYKLSGGEKRRLELAILFCSSPSVVLLDEPFLGIDPLGIQSIRDVILRLHRRGVTILMSEQNVREALRLVDRADILHGGRVIYHGSAQSLTADPQVRAHLLGEDFRL